MGKYNIIVAMDSKNGIAKNGKIPWDLVEDRVYFKKITTETKDKSRRNVVVMGRKTWESLPKNNRPLSGRINIVLTKQKMDAVETVASFEELEKKLVKIAEKIEEVFIIGGEQVYKQALDKLNIHKLYITQIQRDYGCDQFFSEFRDRFELEQQEKHRDFYFLRLTNRNRGV
jgi:dihydrofolate reductase